jgi:O-antigen/teichoic acid export membrane protein
VRDGHPDLTSRMDTTRQICSVGAASIYLITAHHPTLLGATLLFCAPYPVIAVLGGLRVWRHRPGIPGPPRLIAALTGEMLGTAVYLQGDVLLLGYLTNSTVVGYYTLAITVGIALVTLGQSFGMTYHEPLRKSGGDLSAGPPLKITVLFGLATGLLMGIVGFALLISPAPTELAAAMLIMAGWCAIRTISSIFQVILYTQRRDLVRLLSAVGLVPFKLLLVAALASRGAVGAAIASVITDATLLFVYSVALYGKRFAKPIRDENGAIPLADD